MWTHEGYAYVGTWGFGDWNTGGEQRFCLPDAQNGSEVGRLSNAAPGMISPYDSPANIAFNGHGSLLVTNHAFFTMIPSQFTVLDVYVGDKGDPLEKPDLP